ncbi:hypothetical protein DKX38_029096 [Salix brachista]|uniref:Protein kinase domain-containing protein n=1 Tax=Salix brachista TaxID=2182728 RepID=A0A5N5IY96_9ROSI|nr:hypothetical protein DKX38_029096 [Salix brachista]
MPGNAAKNQSSHCSWTGIWCSSGGFVEELDLSDMNLSGNVIFKICMNNFIGSFPTGLGMASGLTSINASSNNFSGYLPQDLGNATSLERLDFRGSYFEGSIPGSFKNLQKLKFLGLFGNNLTGRIPREIGQLACLETIILGYNEFEGEIPAEIGNLTNLRYLDLAVGSLSGGIPAGLGRLKRLTTIYLYKNNFTGKIPLELGGATSLVFLDLSDNQISGEIPVELAELKNLHLLNLMRNQLKGTIPTKLGELTKLEELELWKNFLIGPLPENLGRNSPLQWLDVSSNSLSGEIPPVDLESLPILQRLELANNNLTGQIPDEIDLSTSLSFIDVSRNHLQSSLPYSILSIPSLQIFMVSSNNLEGRIPDQFQDCPSLSVLDLSSNHLSRKISESIASCKKLVNLNLQNNQFTGEIPKAISTMPALSILDLSNNSLVNRIPENFGNSPALETLNLSFNKLEGLVPSNGMLTTINPNDLVCNVGLRGGILPPCPPTSSSSKQQQNLRTKHVIIGFIVGISIILSLGITFFTWRLIYKRWYLYNSFFYDWFSNSNKDWPWTLVAFQRISLTSSEILACIKESNIIGMGGTGIMYKAEAYQPHATVAVKKLWRTERDVENGGALFREVNLLVRLWHRNIVWLLGYIYNETDVMMVYEYLPKGNLGTTLHGKEAGNLLVDWVSQYNVAVGVAEGLNYLHHDCHPQSSTAISKYGYTLKIDEKSDIYSFRVVLLELVTRKMPLNPAFGESIDIVEWIRRKIKTLEEALDHSIAGHCKHVQEEILLVLRIAILCTAKLTKDRPSMRDVITKLGEAFVKMGHRILAKIGQSLATRL